MDKKKTKTVYVSLPMTGRTIKWIEGEAARMTADVERAGHRALNPMKIYAGENPVYADHIAADIRALMDCDAVYLHHEWQTSRGCRLEFQAACIYDKEIFTAAGQLADTKQ